MDNQIIQCDFNFASSGVTCDEVESVVKGSPSHESDSGVSSFGSPSHSSVDEEMNAEDQNLYDFDSNEFGEFDNALDSELASYLTIGQSQDDDSNNNDKLISNLTSPISPGSPEDHAQGNAHTLSTINDKPLQFTSDCTSSVRPKPSLPTVKVIKVITTPSSFSKVDTDNIVFEALEERNRKNATQAKINREKKKSYIKDLEHEIKDLKVENYSLKSLNESIGNHKRALEEEVEYLKSVLANQSALAGLLKNIENVKEVHLSSSFMSRKRGADHDHDYDQGSSKRARPETAGVCLHVDKDSVSLEFCSTCSKQAKSTRKHDS